MKCDSGENGSSKSRCGVPGKRPLFVLLGVLLLVWIGLRLLDLFRGDELEEVVIFPPHPEPAFPPYAAQDLSETMAEEPLASASAETSIDDLTQINGIGPVYARQLQDAGITTFAQLAALTATQLDDMIDAPDWREPDYQGWIDQARDLSRP